MKNKNDLKVLIQSYKINDIEVLMNNYNEKQCFLIYSIIFLVKHIYFFYINNIINYPHLYLKIF